MFECCSDTCPNNGAIELACPSPLGHTIHWENYISIHIEWDMIVVTVFLSILKEMEFHLVQNRKVNCHHNHIPFNVKGIGCIVSRCRNSIHRKLTCVGTSKNLN